MLLIILSNIYFYQTIIKMINKYNVAIVLKLRDLTYGSGKYSTN